MIEALEGGMFGMAEIGSQEQKILPVTPVDTQKQQQTAAFIAAKHQQAGVVVRLAAGQADSDWEVVRDAIEDQLAMNRKLEAKIAADKVKNNHDHS